MARKLNFVLTEWLTIIAAWFVILYLYFLCAAWGMHDYLAPGIMADYLLSWHAQVEVIFQAIAFGLAFAMINTFVDRTSLRIRSFGAIILIKSILYMLAIVLVAMLTFFIYYAFEIVPRQTLQQLVAMTSFRFVFSMLVYISFFIILLNFLLQVNRKFGPGNLIKLITGKYDKPQDEERIFLFLDMKGSTRIAEKLGHKTYSRLLRDCYHELTDIVIKYRAEIYQFVGDEVVLCWNLKSGLKNLNCVKAFFAYAERLRERKPFYQEQFDAIPVFKGGMDMGTVTVAEIGDIKREIAYHGDVLDTASRIQELCNQYNQPLLISENLAKHLINLNGYHKNLVGELSLRGKGKSVKVYSLGNQT